jgi:hypothetical protein
VKGPPAASRGRTGLFWQRRGSDVLGISAIVGFILAYLSPAVKDGGSFGSFDTVISYSSLGTGAYPGLPHNILNGDSVTQLVPMNAYDWTAIHHLQFPLWNDLNLLGLPQFLNFQSATLSLPDIVSYLSPLRFAFLVVVAMKLLIAGTGAYALCRVLGLRALASTLGGVIVMLSGAFAGWLTWPLSDVVGWLGWIVALVILAYRWQGKRSYVVLLAMAVAFCVYGGFPEAYFFVAGALLTLFVVLVVLALFRRRRFSLQGIFRVVTGLVAGAALSAPLWFAGLQVVKASHRATLAGFAGLPANSLALLVAPGYYGLPIKGSTWFYSTTNYYETVVYVGVIALVLAGAAVIRWWRHPMVVALAAVIVVAFAISYQTNSFHPVLDVLRHTSLDTLPISRMRIVAGLPLGVLSALGLETLLRARGERHILVGYWVMSALVAVFVGLLWYRSLGQRLAAELHQLRIDSLLWPTGLVVACVLAGGLFLLGRNPAQRRSARWPALVAAAVLVGSETAFLVFSGIGINSYSEAFFPATPAISQLKAIVGSQLVGLDTDNPLGEDFAPVGIYPDANLGYGIAEFAGHDPVLPQAYFKTRGGASHLEPDIDSAALARRFGISWILQVPGSNLQPPAGTRYVGSFAGEDLYSVPGAARFSLVSASGSGASSPVSNVSHPTSSSWTLRFDAPASRRLVLRVTDLPGWHATLDGHALALSRYQALMLVASVPAGPHVVRLWYLPERLVIGTWLALGTLAALLAWASWPLVRRSKRPDVVYADLGESFAPALIAAELAGREPRRKTPSRKGRHLRPRAAQIPSGAADPDASPEPAADAADVPG